MMRRVCVFTCSRLLHRFFRTPSISLSSFLQAFSSHNAARWIEDEALRKDTRLSSWSRKKIHLSPRESVENKTEHCRRSAEISCGSLELATVARADGKRDARLRRSGSYFCGTEVAGTPTRAVNTTQSIGRSRTIRRAATSTSSSPKNLEDILLVKPSF